MFEVLVDVSGRGQASFALLLLGLAVGSFSSVVLHRVPLNRSIVGPRSECHQCGSLLSVVDLVPVFSFIWLRGRCRHCGVRIPWRYPALELGCGFLAALAGLAGGWLLGLILLALWVAAVWVRAKGRRHSAAGSTLIEVLVSAGLLTAVVIPMLNFAAYRLSGTAFQRQIAVSLASSKLEELGNEAYRVEDVDTWPTSGAQASKVVGRYSFRLQWTVTPFESPDQDWTAEGSQLRQATVTVTCNNCQPAMPPVRMVTVLAKL